LLICSNLGYKIVNVTLDLSPAIGYPDCNMEMLFEGGQIAIIDGVLSDVLQPMQCRAYRIPD